jgi:hypothetical protein
MSFEADMRKIAAKIDESVEQLGRAVKLELFKGAIQDTRVDTGQLIGNWQTSEEAPILTQIDRLDPQGSAAIAEAESVVQGVSLTYMTNNLPYAEVYEEKDAMVAKNVARVKHNIAKKARELNK